MSNTAGVAATKNMFQSIESVYFNNFPSFSQMMKVSYHMNSYNSHSIYEWSFFYSMVCYTLYYR